MDKSDEPIAAAIKKVLELHTERITKGAVTRELGIYLAASAEKRQVAARRLMAFSQLPAASDRTKADVLAVAASLGVEQSNVYRMLKRIKEFGPVSGLLPGNRVKPKSGAAADGFDEPVDGWIADALRTQPEVSISDLSRMLGSKAKLLTVADPTKKVVVPGSASLRRRVQALRVKGFAGEHSRLVGASVLVDQCWTRVQVRSPEGPGRQVRHDRVSVVMIIDEATSIILGCGAYLGADAATGLVSALEDTAGRCPKLESRGLKFFSRPSRVRWMIPPVLLPRANEIERNAASFDPPIELLLLAADEDRSGIELRRNLGGKLGPFELLTRLDREDGPGLMGSPASKVEKDHYTLADVSRAFLTAVVDRNDRRVRDMAKDKSRLTSDRDFAAPLFCRAMFKLFSSVN